MHVKDKQGKTNHKPFYKDKKREKKSRRKKNSHQR